MPDTETVTCGAKATIAIGRHTEADVECGLEVDHANQGERNHLTSQPTTAKDAKTGKEQRATIIFAWS